MYSFSKIGFFVFSASLILGESYAAICPSNSVITPCRCDEDTLTVDCSNVFDGAQLFNIFQNHFPNRYLEILIIDGAPLTYLIDQTFAQVSFHNITIVNTGITEFEGYFFSGSERTLRRLDLSNNAIGRFTFATKRYQALQELVLAGNDITYLTTAEFTEGSLPVLKRVDLSRNGLSSIESRTFQFLETLESLDLSRNQLASLDPVALYVPGDNFGFLDLSGNRLQKIDMAGIGKAPMVIDASNNNIATLDEANYAKLFDSMSSDGALIDAALHLQGNPLVCDCGTAWIFSGSASSDDGSNLPYRDIIREAECSDVEGNLEDLSEEDFADCLI